MVPVTDVVCGLCVKAHTSGKVPVVPRYSRLSSICYRGDGFDSRVAEGQSPYGQGADDEGAIHSHIGV